MKKILLLLLFLCTNAFAQTSSIWTEGSVSLNFNLVGERLTLTVSNTLYSMVDEQFITRQVMRNNPGNYNGRILSAPDERFGRILTEREIFLPSNVTLRPNTVLTTREAPREYQYDIEAVSSGIITLDRTPGFNFGLNFIRYNPDNAPALFDPFNAEELFNAAPQTSTVSFTYDGVVLESRGSSIANQRRYYVSSAPEFRFQIYRPGNTIHWETAEGRWLEESTLGDNPLVSDIISAIESYDPYIADIQERYVYENNEWVQLYTWTNPPAGTRQASLKWSSPDFAQSYSGNVFSDRVEFRLYENFRPEHAPRVYLFSNGNNTGSSFRIRYWDPPND